MDRGGMERSVIASAYRLANRTHSAAIDISQDSRISSSDLPTSFPYYQNRGEGL